MDYLSKFLAAFSTSARVAASAAVFTSIILVLYNKYPHVLEIFGAFQLVDEYRAPTFFICLGTSTIFSVYLISEFFNLCKKIGVETVVPWLQFRADIKSHRSILSTLSKPEKDFLRRYIEDDVGTIHEDMSSGIANGLMVKRIVFRSSNLGIPGTLQMFPYNIQPLTKTVLKKYPELLD